MLAMACSNVLARFNHLDHLDPVVTLLTGAVGAALAACRGATFFFMGCCFLFSVNVHCSYSTR